jgi:hypothetical protein
LQYHLSLRSKHARTAAATTLAVALIVGVGVINVSVLDEAYGAGPPYYGLTLNMDKWTSPWPLLVGIDIAALALAVVVAHLVRRAKRDKGEK